MVRVFGDADRMLFVDGERGDDAAIGSMDAPLRSIGAAALLADGRDIYVRSVGTYGEDATVRLGPGTSLYGGFDADWKRDRSQRVRLEGAAVAVVVDGDVDRTIGSIELTAADADAGRTIDRDSRRRRRDRHGRRQSGALRSRRRGDR